MHFREMYEKLNSCKLVLPQTIFVDSLHPHLSTSLMQYFAKTTLLKLNSAVNVAS
jgi:hypothetical protein